MSIQVEQPRAASPGPAIYRLNVRQFLRRNDAGVFPDDARVELLAGLLVPKMTKNNPHDFAVSALGYALRAMLPPDWIVREEKSVVLGRYWRPEPDLVVARGPVERYRGADPTAADVPLVIEVAGSSASSDRGLKGRRYAAVGIPIYWIVDVERRQVEVFTDPHGRGRAARYRDVKVFPGDARVPVVIEGRELGPIAVPSLMC
jgi:Uma2 family endonuclease